MKKIIKSIIIFIIITIPLFVKASSGTISIYGSNNVVSGNNITFTVRLQADVSMVSWQMNLNYDKSFLSLISTSSESKGTLMSSSSASGTKTVEYTYTFKALKTGSTSLNVGSYEAYSFNDLSGININSGAKNIKIITLDELIASYSKDNNLSSLEVEGYELEEEFKMDNLEYNLTVPEDTKEVNVIAKVHDNTATVEGAGIKELTPGSNKIEITVRAQNGSEKKYILNIEVKDNDPIETVISGKKYTVVKIKEYLTAPSSFIEKEITIKDKTVPAFYNENLKITLVGLKNEEGEIGLYIYEDDTYHKYIEISSGNLTIYPIEKEIKLNKYKNDIVKIKGENVPCLTLNKKSRFKVIYGINVESGEEGYYQYDTKDQTIIKYDDELIKVYEKQNVLLVSAAGAFIITTILALLGLLKAIKTKKHKNNKVQEELEDTKELERVENVVIEQETNDSEEKESITEEIYDIFEDDKKKRKKKTRK